MLGFTLPGGRRIEMGDLYITQTRYELDRGGHELRICDLIGRMLLGDDDYVILWPKQGDLGRFICIAPFSSDPLVLDETEGVSEIVVCWFAWHVDRHLREIVQPVLDDLDWERSAKDRSFW